ncbi:hypothetical protein QQF64_033523 [Cirrhinus molitorella]|uniref:Secreted protein n=1 Tax=Cirrhinus molitorella TaxID=172907 RepID=A0ABR3MU50_9TELE
MPPNKFASTFTLLLTSAAADPESLTGPGKRGQDRTPMKSSQRGFKQCTWTAVKRSTPIPLSRSSSFCLSVCE